MLCSGAPFLGTVAHGYAKVREIAGFCVSWQLPPSPRLSHGGWVLCLGLLCRGAAMLFDTSEAAIWEGAEGTNVSWWGKGVIYAVI